MKSIQLIARVNRGGTANWLRVLTEGLKANGDEVYLAAGNVDSTEVEDPAFEELNGIRVHGLGRSVSPVSDIRAIFKLRNIVRELKPDIVNTHTAKAGLLGRLACIGLPPKVVHTYHGHLLYGYFSKNKTKLIMFVEKFLSIYTDFFIAVGTRVKQDLVNTGIGIDSKFQVVFPAIEKPKKIGSSEARELLGIDSDAKVIGWLGRLTSIKRPDRVVELAKIFPNVTFLIGGFGELETELESNAGKNMKFVGWVEPDIFWSACDVALLTSDNEGVPTSLIEAAMHGLPIVAEKVGSVSDVFESGVGGYLVTGDEARAKAISLLINDAIIANQMGQEAQKFATHRFSTEVFLSAHIKLYESLVRGPSV